RAAPAHVAVRAALPLEVVGADRALEPTSLHVADDVDAVSRREDVDLELGADLEVARLVEPDLAEVAVRIEVDLLQVTVPRLAEELLAHRLERELHREVAVGLRRLHLRHAAGAGGDDRDRDLLAALGEDVRHPDLATHHVLRRAHRAYSTHRHRRLTP